MKISQWMVRSFASAVLMCASVFVSVHETQALGFEYPGYQFEVERQERVYEEYTKLHMVAWPEDEEKTLFNSFKFYVGYRKVNRTVELPKQVIALLPGQSLPVEGNFGRSPDTDSFKESWEYELIGSQRWIIGMEGRVANFEQHVPFQEPGYCDVNDCSPMKHWDVKRMAEDLKVAVEATEDLAINMGADDLEKPAVWGYSLGATTASAAIAEYPELFSEFVLFEVALFSRVEEMINIQQPWCNQLYGAFEFEVYASSDLYNVFAGLALGAQFTPDAVLPGPLALGLGFVVRDGQGIPVLDEDGNPQPEAISFYNAFVAALIAPPGQYLNTFVQFAHEIVVGADGQIGLDLLNVDIEDVFALVGGLHPVDSLVHNYAAECGMAGDPFARSYFDGIEDYEGNVYGFAAELGFGRTVEETVGLFSNAEIQTLTGIAAAGHADPIVNSRIYRDVIVKVIGQLDDF